jgi:hypothetical protein
LIGHREIERGEDKCGGAREWGRATMNEDRYGLRRILLDRIVALQLEVQSTNDPEARALLEEARDALQAFDAESLRKEVSGGR